MGGWTKLIIVYKCTMSAQIPTLSPAFPIVNYLKNKCGGLNPVEI